jgi:antitoxin MazE6
LSSERIFFTAPEDVIIALGPIRGMRERTEDVVLVILIKVIPGYTEGMKTAISLPDDTYEQATRQAQALGISRSEFFARAARSYLDQLASRSLTQQIDEALRTGDDDSNAAAAAAGRSYLAGQDDW